MLFQDWKRRVETIGVPWPLEDRGDEPEDCWENGDTPEEYAASLNEEFELYGPEGE